MTVLFITRAVLLSTFLTALAALKTYCKLILFLMVGVGTIIKVAFDPDIKEKSVEKLMLFLFLVKSFSKPGSKNGKTPCKRLSIFFLSMSIPIILLPSCARACYDESKRLGETLCMTYFRQYGVPVKIVRIFNVYGPGLRVDDERVLPSFVSRALKGEDMIIRTSGYTRAFCYITDIINGIFRLLFSKYNGEPTNIGNPNEEISMLELAIKVKHLLGNKINVKEEKAEGVYGESNPKRRCPDISKAEKLLNYSPKVDLNNGLTRFVEWAKTEWV